MDLNLILANPNLLAAGAAGFFVGALLARLSSGAARREALKEDPRNHRIRELEADLRATRKQLAEQEKALEQKSGEFTTSVATLQTLNATLSARDEQIRALEADLQGSIAKTNELRRELQERAAETVREQVRAEEAVTELQVERAGSEAVMNEIARLQQERQRLTDTMHKLGGSLMLDEELFGTDNS